MGVIRYSIPLAAILVGLAAFAVRPAGGRGVTAGASETAGAGSPVLPAADEASGMPAAFPVGQAIQPVLSADRAAAVLPVSDTLPKAVPEPHVQNRPLIVALLERELSLSPGQRRQVEEVLLRREREIDLHHRQLRTVGAVSGQAYHRHMQELRALSYSQVGQVLDTDQHRKFLALLADGALNDLIGIAMDEGMVELD